MSDKVKLIIEISKEQYNKIKEDSLFLNFAIMANAIKNGTPLDDVRAEIEEEYNRLSATRADETLELGECLGLKMALKILDHIGRK